MLSGPLANVGGEVVLVGDVPAHEAGLALDPVAHHSIEKMLFQFWLQIS